MRKCILLLSLLLPIVVSAQNDSLIISRDSIINEINNAVQSIKFRNESVGRFKIYQTDNIYILLKLDTATGIIKMVQWNMNRTKEFEAYLNSEDLSDGVLRVNGRYELYPTKNMYQFILIDTLLGTTWHVQWGIKPSEQWIRRILFS